MEKSLFDPNKPEYEYLYMVLIVSLHHNLKSELSSLHFNTKAGREYILKLTIGK
jgi:hypothetical protein